MTSPYRSANPPERRLRPLEPEAEMRLVEEKWELDRKYARPWAVYVPAILGLACLVLIVFTPPKLQIVFCVLAFFFLPSVGTVIARRRFHRVVARLREEGYDVSELNHRS